MRSILSVSRSFHSPIFLNVTTCILNVADYPRFLHLIFAVNGFAALSIDVAYHTARVFLSSVTTKTIEEYLRNAAAKFLSISIAALNVMVMDVRSGYFGC